MRHLRSTVDPAGFRKCFQLLSGQTRTHFAHEERVMRNIAYPAFHRHKIAHDKVLADFDDFTLNIGTVLANDDLRALARHFEYWFRHHVQEHHVALLHYIDRTE